MVLWLARATAAWRESVARLSCSAVAWLEWAPVRRPVPANEDDATAGSTACGADGAALAVRRIGSDDAGVRRFSELDAQMRAVAKLRHGNILRLRGFYWGPDEMLIIHEFAPNGNLANLSVKSA